MSSFFPAGTQAEVRQGKSVADAAASAGVGHVIHSSVASADRRTGIPHFESKHEIECHVATLGLRRTVIRPVYFMENVVTFGLVQEGKLLAPLPPFRSLQQVSVRDIASLTALAIENPERFDGAEIDIAGDEVTGEETAAIIGRTSGQAVAYQELPVDAIRSQSEDLAVMYEWLNDVGYSIDIDRLRADCPEIQWTSYAQWAAAQDWTGVA